MRVEEEIADLGFDDECLIDLGQRADKTIDRLCAEIIALRAKLAAAEASLAERGRMLELTNRVQREYRATVAAALAELRLRIAAESVPLTPENAAGYSRDIADAENATVELALRHVDDAITALARALPQPQPAALR